MENFIYIPLCFYFISVLPAIHRWSLTFTFHYASTLSGCTAMRGCPAMLSTFHYASTLSTCRETHERNLANLHSTMLLLYRASPSHPGSFRIHLHSTMLLLYRDSPRAEHRECLHLHSTMLLLYRYSGWIWPERENIYIPLCFYFIRSGRSSVRSNILFTFHYASTLSLSNMK